MEVVSENRRSVTITLTHNCNLHCRYCYETHDTARMKPETAIRIVEEEFSKLSEGEEIEFCLFGGEPFLEFETIKEIYHYIKHRQYTNPYCLFASTNGTLVHGEVQEWLQKSPYFYCGLSYDGDYDMQNINRSDSAGLVDLDFFKEVYPEQAVKMTISEESLKTLYTGIRFLQDRGFEVACNLAYCVNWDNKDNIVILERELMKLIRYYLDNPTVEPCSILQSNIDRVCTYPEEEMYKFCGCGTKTIAYDVDGVSYPCQLFMPLSCGKEKAEKAHTLVFPDTFTQEMVEEKCRKCVVKCVCPNCLGANYMEFGNIYQHNDSYCQLIKTVMKARSYFRALQWEAGQIRFDSREQELTMLKSIDLIQKQL